MQATQARTWVQSAPRGHQAPHALLFSARTSRPGSFQPETFLLFFCPCVRSTPPPQLSGSEPRTRDLSLALATLHPHLQELPLPLSRADFLSARQRDNVSHTLGPTCDRSEQHHSCHHNAPSPQATPGSP